MRLTDKSLQRLATAAPQWLVDGASLPAGSLVAYIGAKPARGEAARSFYYRWRHNGRQERLPIGTYAADGESNPGPEPGGALSLRGARQRARQLADLVHAGEGDLRGYLARQRQAAEEARRAAEAAAQAEVAARERGSLEKLVDAYLSGLEAAGKPSARDARNLLSNHVLKAHRELAARKAAEIAPADLRPVFATLIEAGKGRTAAKVRGYLHAAYKQAGSAEHDPTAPVAMLGFGIAMNPVAMTPALSKFNRVGERALGEAELGAYVRELLADTSIRTSTKAALLLSLALGGQRPAQLLQATAADLDLDDGIIQLHDAKGRRQQPRVHVLPITSLTDEILRDLRARHPDERHLFIAQRTARVRVESLSKIVAKISARMVKGGTATVPFRLGDIRRT
jgi:integrase